MSYARNYEEFFLHAQKVRRLITEDFSEAFQKVDVLLTPTSICESKTYADFICEDNRTQCERMDVLTQAPNLAGTIHVAQLLPSQFNELQAFYVFKCIMEVCLCANFKQCTRNKCDLFDCGFFKNFWLFHKVFEKQIKQSTFKRYIPNG